MFFFSSSFVATKIKQLIDRLLYVNRIGGFQWMHSNGLYCGFFLIYSSRRYGTSSIFLPFTSLQDKREIGARHESAKDEEHGGQRQKDRTDDPEGRDGVRRIFFRVYNNC